MSLQRIARAGVLRAIDALQVPRFILALRSAPLIMLYHGVSSERGDGIFNYRSKFITPEAFEEQIKWLKRHYSIVPLGELIEKIVQGGSLPKRRVAITFDDGYKNNFEDAFPILRRAGVPATFFVTTDFVGAKKPLPVDIVEYAIGTLRDSITLRLKRDIRTFPLRTREERIRADLVARAHLKTLPKNEAQTFLDSIIEASGRDLRADLLQTPYRPMSWSDIGRMEEAGMAFAAHTCSHPILSRLSLEEIETEIAGSTAAVRAHARHAGSVFAYPNGKPEDISAVVIASLKKNGYTAALTTRAAPVAHAEDPFHIPRFTLDGTNDLYRFRLTLAGVMSFLERMAG